MKLKLPSGATGFFNDRNEWVCTGSQMGRRNLIPSDPDELASLRFRLQRLPMCSQGDYDKWGAYWGLGNPLYVAWTDYAVKFGDSLQMAQVYVRAKSRSEAKQLVRKQLHNARFYV